jgi:hypothetical protein
MLGVASAISPESLVGGPRQREIVGLAGLRIEQGMKIAEIAREIHNPDVPNVYLTMRALDKRGLGGTSPE